MTSWTILARVCNRENDYSPLCGTFKIVFGLLYPALISVEHTEVQWKTTKIIRGSG